MRVQKTVTVKFSHNHCTQKTREEETEKFDQMVNKFFTEHRITAKVLVLQSSSDGYTVLTAVVSWEE
jgi:hypothetical protein